MAKDLTNSPIDRQNILNNQYALEEIRKETGLTGLLYIGEYRFTKEQAAKFFEVDVRTIERYLESNSEELSVNGYQVLRGKSLEAFKLWLKTNDVTDINVGHKTVNLGLFNFRSFLNLTMFPLKEKRLKGNTCSDCGIPGMKILT